jgi:hypothetical protein
MNNSGLPISETGLSHVQGAALSFVFILQQEVDMAQHFNL